MGTGGSVLISRHGTGFPEAIQNEIFLNSSAFPSTDLAKLPTSGLRDNFRNELPCRCFFNLLLPELVNPRLGPFGFAQGRLCASFFHDFAAWGLTVPRRNW